MRAWILATIVLAAALLPAAPVTAAPSCVPSNAEYLDQLAHHVRYDAGKATFKGYRYLYFTVTSDSSLTDWTVLADHVGIPVNVAMQRGASSGCATIDTLGLDTTLAWEVIGGDLNIRMYGMN